MPICKQYFSIFIDMGLNDNIIYMQILAKTPINYHYLYKITTGENKYRIKLVKMEKLIKFKEYVKNEELTKVEL